MQAATVRLNEEQIAFFHREGYLALEAITTQEEIAFLRGVYDRLFAQRAGREEGNQFDLAGTDEEGVEARLPQILSPSKYAPEIRETLYMANALAIARQLLGEDATFHGDHAIMKPPHHGAETPWHQDEAYWSPDYDYHEVNIWMPLQPATPENGCMWFVPGSHRWEVLPHHPIGHDPRVHGLEVDQADTSNAVCCPLPAGGATIHTPRTLHYAPANRSDQPRRALVFAFGTPAVPRTVPRDFPWNRIKQTARQERAEAFVRKNT